MYKERLDLLLHNSNINFSNLEQSVDIIVECILQASNETLRKIEFKPYLKPYWSPELKELHRKMRFYRSCWLAEGKNKDNSTAFQSYKRSKREFRRTLRRRHRRFEREEFEKIDNLLEIDQNTFWKYVNAKRKSKQNTPGKEIVFNQKPVTKPDDLVQGWADFFKSLFSETENASYDIDFKHFVETSLRARLSEVHNENSSLLHSKVTREELTASLLQLPNGKAAGIDNITYEHLKYGGEILIKCLLTLYQNILDREHIPRQFKLGLII